MKLQITFLLLFSQVFVSKAQWNSDPTVNTAVCTASFKQKEVRLDSDSDGGAFVVWKDYRTGTTFGEPDIYIQKIDSNGYVEWTVDGAPICVLPSDQSTPSITTDEKGGMIIAWSDRRSGLERDIYAQRIDINGQVLWDLNGVPVASKVIREHSEKIISDDNSGIMVVWEQERIIGVDTTWDIWAQRIDSSGNPVWAVGGIPICLEASNRINHKIQRDGDGGFIATWQDQRTGDFDIWAQHVDGNGNLLWGNNGKPICISTGVQTNPKVDPEKQSDGIFVAWVDKRNGTDYDIYCNRLDSNGNVLWGPSGKPVVVTNGNQSALDILSNNKTQGIIVTWKDNRSSEYDIYAQKIDMQGQAEWQTNGIVVCNAISKQLNPNIISDKHGGAIIVWQDERGADWDIYAQRISYNGNPIWQSNGEPVSLAVGNQTSPKNVPDNKGGTIVAWEDKRGGFSKDIYIHHLLIEDTVTYPDDGTGVGINEVFAAQDIDAYPNPFKNLISVSFNDNSNIENYEIEIVDILGKKYTDFTYEYDSFLKVITINTKKTALNKGIYYVILKNNSLVFSTKIIKE